MAKKSAPLFRKSMSGYNKEDVNSYILSLNRTLEENKRQNEKTLSEYNVKAEEADRLICDLRNEISDKDAKILSLEEKTAELDSLKEESKAKDDEIARLNELVASLQEKVAAYEAECDGEKEKADNYDSLCSKAGEILVIASSTAEDILNRANSEALKIVGEANTKKDLMLKTFSESVDAAVDDINTYIKTAVNRCVIKINDSVKEVSKMAKVQNEQPAIKRPKTIYVSAKK